MANLQVFVASSPRYYLRWDNKTISLQIRQQPFMDDGAGV
jgi:hypothetical protein